MNISGDELIHLLRDLGGRCTCRSCAAMRDAADRIEALDRLAVERHDKLRATRDDLALARHTLRRVRRFIRGDAIEHAIMDMAEPNVGLGRYIGRALRRRSDGK